jgi:hypothetical protein
MRTNALPERPNSVFGLNARREELIRYRKQLQGEIRKITVDIDHLETAARLFTDGASFTGFKPYIVHHRARSSGSS